MNVPLNALQLYNFLDELKKQGHYLGDIKIMYRYDRDSDDAFVYEVEEDLYDMQTNSRLETIMFLTNPKEL